MKYVQIHLDYETSESCGAGGMFQVASIVDENDNDITSHVDVGHHYSSLEQVQRDLQEALGCEVDLEEV